ncbi:MAG: hypothetical protein PVH19_10910, partial [Planctomycetia bacterium]
MYRFSHLLKLALCLAILAMVGGTVCAQEEETAAKPAAGLEYHRVFVPHDRPELWPTQKERYIPIPEKEFQKLLDAANQGTPKQLFASPDLKITSADYEVELEANRLVGEATLNVVRVASDSTGPAFLVLGPANLSVKNVVKGKEKQPMATGVDKLGRLVAQLDRSGTVRFDFAARNRSIRPDEFSFDLTLPRSTRSTVSLLLDPGWELSVPSGLLLGRDVEDPKLPDSKIRWTVAPTLSGRFRLLLTKKKETTALPEIPKLSESLVYEFSPRGLELRAAFHLTSKDGSLPNRLRVVLEKPLTLISARLGSEPVKWFLESEEDGQTIVSLSLSKSLSRSETLRIKATCPIVENDDWRLPRITPQKVFWRAGDMTLLVTSPLSLGKLVPQGGVRTKVGELPG